jgi:small conductance mechanosensitive channel
MSWAQLRLHLEAYIIPYGTRILVAIIILLIGFWAAKILRATINRSLLKRKTEDTVRIFLGHITYAIILLLAAIAALANIGVQTASLVAVLGATFFAIALSLRNSLSSLASGILLVIFRPFKVGDDITVESFSGTVKEIQLMFTQLVTGDNKSIFVPNERLTSSPVTNASTNTIRRNDILVRIDYDSDLKKAKTILLNIADGDKRILNSPVPPIAAVQALAESSVNLILRYWTTHEGFNQVQFDVLEQIKLRFDSEGITIPYPHTVTHVGS